MEVSITINTQTCSCRFGRQYWGYDHIYFKVLKVMVQLIFLKLLPLPLMNSFNKTEAANFTCKLCFPFISLIELFMNSITVNITEKQRTVIWCNVYFHAGLCTFFSYVFTIFVAIWVWRKWHQFWADRRWTGRWKWIGTPRNTRLLMSTTSEEQANALSVSGKIS